MSPHTHIPDEAVEAAARGLCRWRWETMGQTNAWDHVINESERGWYRDSARAALSAALPIVLASRENDTRADELGRWLDAGEVAGYASVADLLNAMRVRRDRLTQGVPASPPASRDSETAALREDRAVHRGEHLLYLRALTTAVAPLGHTEGDVKDAPMVRAVNAAHEIERLREEVAHLRRLHDQRDAIERDHPASLRGER
jgi:hypothetical protein